VETGLADRHRTRCTLLRFIRLQLITRSAQIDQYNSLSVGIMGYIGVQAGLFQGYILPLDRVKHAVIDPDSGEWIVEHIPFSTKWGIFAKNETQFMVGHVTRWLSAYELDEMEVASVPFYNPPTATPTQTEMLDLLEKLQIDIQPSDQWVTEVVASGY